MYLVFVINKINIVSTIQVQKTCDSRVKHLTAATEELTKFEDELKKFNIWSDATGKELDRQIEAVQESDNIRRITELHKVGNEVEHLKIWCDGKRRGF